MQSSALLFASTGSRERATVLKSNYLHIGNPLVLIPSRLVPMLFIPSKKLFPFASPFLRCIEHVCDKQQECIGATPRDGGNQIEITLHKTKLSTVELSVSVDLSGCCSPKKTNSHVLLMKMIDHISHNDDQDFTAILPRGGPKLPLKTTAQ